ncbi:MAG: hypothetical protein H6734_02355 [Alphaproteobacteria bacterium]|nr:hypothetical protein [Alphaproteobacteria bacterium]
MRDERDNGLAWAGRPPEKRAGGFVDGVGLNQKTHELAVDPEGVVGPAAPAAQGSRSTMLKVERLDGQEPTRVQRNGRVRLSST